MRCALGNCLLVALTVIAPLHIQVNAQSRGMLYILLLI